MPPLTPQPSGSIQSVPLSPVDELFWRAEKYCSDAFRVGIIVRLDGCIEAAPLRAALQHVQQRHPKLRARIAEGSDGRPRYEFEPPAPPIPFEITDHDDTASLWREEMRRLLRRPFAAVGPVAAISVLRNRSRSASDLLVTAHHAIADGLSAIVLVHDVLTEYANAESRDTPAPYRPLPMVSEARTTSSFGWGARLWMLRRYLRMQREERRSRQTRLPEAHDIPSQSQWMHWVFSPEDTVKLVRRCRKEQTSLNGMLMAAACCGLMECLAEKKGVFKCQFPFNLRDSLEGPAGPVTQNDLGNFVSIMNAFYEVTRSPVFWDLARRAQEDIDAFTRHGGPSFFFNLATLAASRLFAPLTRSPRAQSAMMGPAGKRVTLLATNYGVLNMSNTYGSLRPRECTLVFKSDVVGPSLVLEALVMGQRLNIGLAADGLEPTFWEQLNVSIHRHLTAAVAQ
jgi:hypothetical protein